MNFYADDVLETPSTIRIVMMGSNSVGKTSLCGLFTSNFFFKEYLPTNDLQTFRKLTEINNTKILLQIDDLFPINHFSLVNSKQESSNTQIFQKIVENKRTRSQKKYENPIYLEKPIDGFVFVFDLSNKESFEIIEKMINYIFSQELQNKNRKTTKKILIGNKSDLNKTVVKNNDTERVKINFGMKFMKTSALTLKNVNAAFESLIKDIVDEKFELDLSHSSVEDTQFITLERPQPGIFA